MKVAPLPIEGLDDARPTAAVEVDAMLGLLGLRGEAKPRKVGDDRWEFEARVLGAPTVRAAVPELRKTLSALARLSRTRAQKLTESADEIERYLARPANGGSR